MLLQNQTDSKQNVRSELKMYISICVQGLNSSSGCSQTSLFHLVLRARGASLKVEGGGGLTSDSKWGG